jgi:hypothetical protein
VTDDAIASPVQPSIARTKSVLCIPGPWKDQNAFATAIADAGRYLCAGGMLMDLQSKSAFNYTFENADKRMAQAFRAAGPQLPENVLKQIERHRSVLYLISFELNLAGANALMHAAAAVLNAGGLAIKVETAGLAHTAAQWQEFCGTQAQHSAHQAFVVYVSGATSYSCGMHNFGLFDASVSSDDSKKLNTAVELLRTFNWYQISESPQLQSGQSFATQESGPIYQLALATSRFVPTDPFYNAFGTWQLAL